MSDKVRINIYIDISQKHRLEKIQEKVGVPVSEQIRRAIDLYLKQAK